jgi:beta-glucanase (GH16 family)
MRARWPAVLIGATLVGCSDDIVFQATGADPQERDAAVPGPSGPEGDWRLTFGEECEGPLDPERINTFMTSQDGSGPSRTWDLRAEYMADENVRVADGECRILAEQRENGGRQYTSGTLNTGGHFAQREGYFEARIWPPAGRGFWTFWWLRDAEDRWPPAIEPFNFSGSNAHFSAQFYDPDGNQHGTQIEAQDLTLGFHVAGVEWTASELVFFLDGAPRARFSADAEKLSSPMYPALNLSIHTGELDDPPPDDTTPWPGVLRVDWIRVWQKE